jgi:hypothetical protein
MQDILTVVGTQEANLGPTSNATATEVSVAESARLTSTGMAVDAIDGLLSELARAGGEILLMEMSPDTVSKIVGPGASWPTLDRETIKEQIVLEVQAASSGRPNRNLEMANFTQIAPILMQIPGVSAKFMAKEAVKRLDDRLDLEEAFAEGLPPVQQQGPMPQPEATGETPATEQGPQGEPPQGQGNPPVSRQPTAPGPGPIQVTPTQLRSGNL